MQEQSAAVDLRYAAQRFQHLDQLTTGGEGLRVVLRAQDIVGAFDQGGGAVHVLQRRKAQHGQAQQVFGLGQTPVLATLAEQAGQALGQALLLALQIHQQIALGGQFIRRRQAGQAPGDARLAFLDPLLRRGAERLHLAQLLGRAALLLVQLPGAPATGAEGGQPDQQRQPGRATATGLGRHGFGRLLGGQLRGLFADLWGCFAHESFSFESVGRRRMGAQGRQNSRSTGAATIDHLPGACRTGQIGHARAGHQQG